MSSEYFVTHVPDRSGGWSREARSGTAAERAPQRNSTELRGRWRKQTGRVQRSWAGGEGGTPQTWEAAFRVRLPGSGLRAFGEVEGHDCLGEGNDPSPSQSLRGKRS